MTMTTMCHTCHCCPVDANEQCIGGCDTDEHPDSLAWRTCDGEGRLMLCTDEICLSHKAAGDDVHCSKNRAECFRACAACDGEGFTDG
jgi:hypothetical protein